MNTIQSKRNVGDGLRALWRDVTRGRRLTRGATWGMMILGALLAFEVFNYSTTQFALRDMLGDLTFGGFRWATILAIAFCGIDFAGIARIFTPQQGRDEPAEVWYLFGAWLLAAGFNAALTWWGVSVAIANHSSAGSSVISNHTLITVVPIFVALMVWLIRVLIIGTFSISGDNLFSMGDIRDPNQRSYPAEAVRPPLPQVSPLRSASSLSRPQTYRPAPKPIPSAPYQAAESTYHNLSFESSATKDAATERRVQ